MAEKAMRVTDGEGARVELRRAQRPYAEERIDEALAAARRAIALDPAPI